MTDLQGIARETLALCLAGRPPEDLPPALADDPHGDALFGILVEGLADRFDPALCEAYARLFSQAVARASGRWDAVSLLARYRLVRRIRPAVGDPRRVFVLSRITLGADVAITSVLMAAAKLRFPRAEIVFAGPRKNFELFAGDPRIRHAEIAYHRGGLRRRLAVWESLATLFADPDSLTIDPDSRLTQLGLLPVCPAERYFFFESRAYGSDSDRPLPELAAMWAAETFEWGRPPGLPSSRLKPWIALQSPARPGGHIAVSLGVGDNTAKRLPDPFEEELLRLLAVDGAPIVIDKGAGGDEAARVERAVARSGVRASFWEGPFAGFASIVSGAGLYAGYDSAGQHVAAAAGVPLIAVFAGFPAPRMFERWRPAGDRCQVIRVDRPEVDATLARVREALLELRG
jgi:ADP-heptose:LPS heptosyltransferase